MDERFEKAETLIKAAAVLVAIFGVWQYFDQAHAEREIQSFNLYEQMYEGRVALANDKLAGGLQPIVDRYLNSQPPLNPNLYPSEVLGLLSGPLRLEYDVMIGFFEKARLCVYNHVCDGNTLRRLLADASIEQSLRLAPKLDEIKRINSEIGVNDYGLGIDCFSRQIVNMYRCFDGY